jgi:hypothetical protein
LKIDDVAERLARLGNGFGARFRHREKNRDAARAIRGPRRKATQTHRRQRRGECAAYRNTIRATPPEPPAQEQKEKDTDPIRRTLLDSRRQWQ